MIAAARGKKLARGAREERASGEKGERDGEGLSDFSWGLEPRSWLDARGLKGAPGTLSLSSAPELLRTREPQAASLLAFAFPARRRQELRCWGSAPELWRKS